MSTSVCVEGIDSLHLVRITASATNYDPSPRDLTTTVENIVSPENEWRLAAATGDEGGLSNPQSSALPDVRRLALLLNVVAPS